MPHGPFHKTWGIVKCLRIRKIHWYIINLFSSLQIKTPPNKRQAKVQKLRQGYRVASHFCINFRIIQRKQFNEKTPFKKSKKTCQIKAKIIRSEIMLSATGEIA